MKTSPDRRIAAYGVALALVGFLVCAAPAAPSEAGTASQPSPQERAQIRAIQCFDHLKRIGGAILLYAGDHQGAFPASLGTLVVAQKLDLPTFVCPAAPSALPNHWQAMTPQAQADWTNAHTDYIYLGAKLTLEKARPDTPIAYEKDDDHGGIGMNVLFGDGHVQFLSLADIHRLLGPKAGQERLTSRVKPAPGQPPAIPLITLDEARTILAKADIDFLSTSIDEFEVDTGRYPTTREGLSALVKKPAADLAGWTHPYIERLPVDPWGHPYRYVAEGRGFHVFSCGPDGKPGTADDIRN